MEDVFGLVGLTLENKYVVEAVVATGGFGVVYRARHAVLGAPVALKVLKIPETLPRRLHAGFVRQFFEEARIVSQLQHPCIVRVTDFGVMLLRDDLQAPWMALEWIDGETLSQHLAARRGGGGRSPREALALMRPVLEAVALAHERGVVHRDLKPGNLMIPKLDLGTTATATTTRTSSRPITPTLRLLDFGLAKVVDESDGPASGQTRTASAMPAFSPRYASPEQASGTRTGPWTDVHALGLILTELLVDAPPYKAADKMTLQIRVMSPTRPTPARFGVDVGAWEPVLAKAVALLPADRYANAGELLDALEAAVPERVSVLPAARVSGESFAVSATSEPAHTTSPTTTIVTTPPPRGPLRAWASALGLVALGAAVAVVAVRASSSPPAAPPAVPARVAAQPPVAPPPAAPAIAAADASVVVPPAPAEETPRARRGRVRRSNRVRPWEQ
ncbi:MAG: serine/threonine-protein kinase [Polyangiales bacterium]